MTSISSPVTRNNERCWSGTSSHMRIYGGLLKLSSSNRVTGCATVSLLFAFVPAPILSRGFCLSSKVMSSWASGGGASSPSGQLISSRNIQCISMNQKFSIYRHPMKLSWYYIDIILLSCGFGDSKHLALLRNVCKFVSEQRCRKNNQKELFVRRLTGEVALITNWIANLIVNILRRKQEGSFAQTTNKEEAPILTAHTVTARKKGITYAHSSFIKKI